MKLSKYFLAIQKHHTSGHTFVLAAEPAEFIRYMRPGRAKEIAAELCDNCPSASHDRATRLRQQLFLVEIAADLKRQARE